VGFDLPTPSFIFIALFFFTLLQFFKKVILSPLAFATVLLLCSFSSLHLKKKVILSGFCILQLFFLVALLSIKEI
jgi:hypothetical protein